MKPTSESILFDLDNTIYDESGSWNKGVEEYYPELKMITHPMSVSLMRDGKILEGCAALKRVCGVGYHLEEEVLNDSVKQIQLLSKQKDVWFVSMAASTYNESQSVFEKRVELIRDFGVLGEKSFFSGNKYEIPGKFMVDDHPDLKKQEELAHWRGITVKQIYNVGKECDLSVDVGDYQKIGQFE